MPTRPSQKKTRATAIERCAVAFALVAFVGALASPWPAMAANTLDPVVTPDSGTTSTVFVFTTGYRSSPPAPAVAVWVDLIRESDGATLRLALDRVAGSTRNGTWRATSTLAAGEWQVTFSADAEGGVASIDAGAIEVSGPTAEPTPTEEPTPPEQPAPSNAPTPRPPRTPAPTPRPPGATPRPPAPAPTSPRGPSATPGPSASGGSSDPSATGSAAPSPSASASVHASVEAVSPPISSPSSPDASPAATDALRERSGSVVPWLVLGGGMATTGAGVLGWQWLALRRRRA